LNSLVMGGLEQAVTHGPRSMAALKNDLDRFRSDSGLALFRAFSSRWRSLRAGEFTSDGNTNRSCSPRTEAPLIPGLHPLRAPCGPARTCARRSDTPRTIRTTRTDARARSRATGARSESLGTIFALTTNWAGRSLDG